ncbi:hypothetical protein IscW_ISCW013071 [Ixodes scapularis]|uniref:Uncharacterized protein n=1 Tax=Ixodes scapularis TaxID=6945 RepID=B7QAP7_IXOSC|nr:hypothetical protein IscW_ISCW013071 [Ixodes scapularis]|eukprot:XP_002412623.1 hypothetical protein IscW_ISCW013071 [Ixodes scapularis]
MGYLRPNGSELRFRREAEYQMSENYSVTNILWIKGGNREYKDLRFGIENKRLQAP